MVAVSEEFTTFTPLGIRCWDPAVDRPVDDALMVTARSLQTPQKPVNALRTPGGVLWEYASETEQGRGEEARTVFSQLRKKDNGYAYTAWITGAKGILGKKEQKFHECQKTIYLDSEAFLVKRIQLGNWREGSQTGDPWARYRQCGLDHPPSHRRWPQAAVG